MPRSGSQARLAVLLAVLGVLALGLVLGVRLPGFESGEGAGGGKKLSDVLTEDQRAQLTRVNAQLSAYGGSTPQPTADLEASCARLDARVPLLGTLADTCAPTILAVKLLALTKSRCGEPAPCARVFRRLSAALPALATARQKYAAQVALAVEPGACAEALKPSARETAALAKLRWPAQLVQQGLEQHDAATYDAGIQQFDEAVQASEDGTSDQARADALRQACGLQATDAPEQPAAVAAPLAALTAEQAARFERASSKLINMTSAVTAPVRPRVVAVRAACGRLDTGQPLLAALAATCEPTAQVMQLLPLMTDRCQDLAPCARLFGRMAKAFAAQADTYRAYAEAIAQSVQAGPCARALSPTAGEIAGTEAAARQAGRVRRALERQARSGTYDPALDAAFKRARARFGAALGASTPDGRPPEVKGDEFRAACGLAKGVDPPA